MLRESLNEQPTHNHTKHKNPITRYTLNDDND